MRPAPLDIQTQGSLGGKRIGMTLDMTSLPHLMSVLTDLYSDPIKAIIREYSTNALDAHAMIGNKAPIEIHTPNQLSPFFKIRDFGPGMSVDFIENVYSQYGNSTKRDTDDQTGMIGIGGKSGLTYTAQFQVISIHNGIKAHVMVTKSEDGSGVMEIVDTVSTDEPSGVEIIIPVQYARDFTAKVNDFFQYWKPGTVLVDGVQPDFIGDREGNFWINDEILIVPEAATGYVVMGNVPYQADGLKDGWADYNVVAFVPMGSVAFPPNRETLMYTEATKATIDRIRKDAQKGIAKVIQAEIDAEDVYLDALAVWDARKGLVKSPYTYRGMQIKSKWDFNTGDNPSMLQFHHTHERNAVSGPQWVSWHDFKNQLTITGFTDEKVTPTIRRKIRQYIAGMPENKPYKVYLTENHPDKVLLPGIRTVTFDVIKDVKLPKPEKRVGKSMEFLTVQSQGWLQSKDSLDPTKKVLYISPGRRKISWGNFSPLLKDFEIVSLYKTEIPKFLKTVPHAEELETWVKDNLMFAKASLTKNDKLAMADVNYYSKRVAQRLDANLIDDPDMVAFINYCKNGRGQASDTQKEYNWAVLYAKALDIRVESIEGASIDDPMEKYPLATNSGGNEKHIILYMNAVYNEEKNNQV